MEFLKHVLLGSPILGMHSDQKKQGKHIFLQNWSVMKLHAIANEVELQSLNKPKANYWKTGCMMRKICISTFIKHLGMVL